MRFSLLQKWPRGMGVCASFAPLVLACSAPLASPGGSDSVERDAAEGASSAALVVVERTVTADDATHGSAVARFVRMRTGSVDDATLRMVGATLDLPAMGTCARAGDSPAFTEVSADGPRAVELLDVGNLAIEANGARSVLEARALPDIVDLVTGVLYSARASLPGGHSAEADLEGIPAHAAYVLRASGREAGEHGVPAFAVSATAPSEPEQLRIEGQDARSDGGVVLTAGGQVELAWASASAPSTGVDPDDVVYVELMSDSSGESATNVRCLFADRGEAVIPPSAFVASHVETGDSEMTRGTIAVHRVHRETFQVSGIESGVIRFDFARAAEFSRR